MTRNQSRVDEASIEPDKSWWLPLTGLSVVDAVGADALAFLQGQFSNDLVALPDGRAQLTGYCSPKGRLLATLVAHRIPGGVRLIVPSDVVDPFLERLRMFVMRANLELRLYEDLRCTGVLGPIGTRLPSGLAAPAEGGWPEASLDVVAENKSDDTAEAGTSVLCWHDHLTADGGSRARWLVVSAPAALVGDEEPLPHTLEPALADALWRLGDIRAGLPSVRATTLDAFIPQTINFGEAGGLSFKKGCYPGQEIVARMQYLGKLKRHMRRFIAESGGASGSASTAGGDEPPAPMPGDVLDETVEARVVDAVVRGGRLELLAVVPIAHAGPLDWHGRQLFEAPLPYAPPGVGEARGRRGDVVGGSDTVDTQEKSA